MRVVIQRVSKASVTIKPETTPKSQIGPGYFVLWAIHSTDTWKDALYCINRVLNMRLFDSPEGKPWSCSVIDKNYAMKTEQAAEMYQKIIEEIEKQYNPDLVKTGKFGCYSELQLNLDGPVTILVESYQEKSKIQKL